jgi:hypothetical protein
MKMTSEMKSRVMSLGNRLAPKIDGDRTAAFIRAWAIVRQGGLELAVKGTSFGNRQEVLKRLAKYSLEQIKTVLVPEPNNPADPAALAVMVGVNNGRGLYRLGYTPRNDNSSTGCRHTASSVACSFRLTELRSACRSWRVRN